jgi:uncharacterized NAD-dependent epimerase/dehydratase family protein
MAALIKRKFKSGVVFYIQYWEGRKQKRIRAHASERIPAKLAGIAVNPGPAPLPEARSIISQMESRYLVPVQDVYRDGAGRLADALEELHGRLFNSFDCHA